MRTRTQVKLGYVKEKQRWCIKLEGVNCISADKKHGFHAENKSLIKRQSNNERTCDLKAVFTFEINEKLTGLRVGHRHISNALDSVVNRFVITRLAYFQM